MLAEKIACSADELREVVRSEMGAMFQDLRGFVDRRIAELSAEVHATVQLVDISEENLTGQLTRIHDQIANVLAAPASATHNSGVELEAVVQATEAAADRILEAAEAIQDWISKGSHDPDAMAELSDKVNSIFEACSFQDLTGQRIRRAIEHLQQVEDMLEGVMPGGRPETAAPKSASLHNPSMPKFHGPDLHQGDIDSVFHAPVAEGGEAKPAEKELAQDAIDALF